MRWFVWLSSVHACAMLLSAQTAEDLVAKNLAARGGLEKIKAIKTLRLTGRVQQGGIDVQISVLSKAPNLLRQAVTIQGMSEIEAYDGSSGWKISPFEGRKDPELMGEDDLRPFVEDADFYGPLVDYRNKDNKIEYLGHDIVDGDDVYRLKVTLANGDFIYYYLDPDTYLEIRTERVVHVRGAVHETRTNLGAYKLVNGVYFPFSMEAGDKDNPDRLAKIQVDRYEANVAVDGSEFKMPASKTSGGKERF